MRNYPAIILAVLAGVVVSLLAGIAMASYATAGALPTMARDTRPPRVVDPYAGADRAFANGWQGQASGSSRL